MIGMEIVMKNQVSKTFRRHLLKGPMRVDFCVEQWIGDTRDEKYPWIHFVFPLVCWEHNAFTGEMRGMAHKADTPVMLHNCPIEIAGLMYTDKEPVSGRENYA